MTNIKTFRGQAALINMANSALEKLQNEYCELQVIKNHLKELLGNLGVKSYSYEFIRNEYKKISNKQIKVKEQINKLYK